MFRYPLKQSFIEYFNLNQIDNTIDIEQLNNFLQKEILLSPNPQQRALEIWDKFVLPTKYFFDTKCSIERANQLREKIIRENDINYTFMAFGIIGVSPFCEDIFKSRTDGGL